jgi:dephospho-CoA kinase
MMNGHTAHAHPAPGKFTVGLTGGIGSGKSTVAGFFRECGVAVIDSDAISHQLTQAGGAAIPAIRSALGNECIDDKGALKREYMRQLVFSDADARKRLEAILHPMIRTRLLAQAQTAATPYLLLVVPLLLEAAGYAGLVQRILVVDCAEEAQIERTVRRSGLSTAEVRAIMAQQISREGRLQHADDIIRNDGDLSALRAQVMQLHQRYLSLASGII